MLPRYLLLCCSLSLILLNQVQAESGNLAIGAKAGTLGGGAEVDLGLTDSIHLRGGANYLKFSFDSTISNIDYEMEPEFKNGSILLDWYPFSAGFRLTGGLFINDNTISLTGSPRRDTLLQDYAIPPEYAFAAPLADSVKVHGSVEFNTLAPYLGIGWNSNQERSQGWGVSLELGVLFQGSPQVSVLTASADAPLDSYTNDPVVVQALESERRAIEEDLENFQYYPVGSIMLHYTF
ncbi:hypothetical protein [Desulfogranum mediterraneum]|uniref:hypothetical protein n=1 Tax=Desulfogranum mediterraneum TaxID=160661 RepID=UPI0004162CB2|nr:hypothetical protein [Desulfogranum mediterraneum]